MSHRHSLNTSNRFNCFDTEHTKQLLEEELAKQAKLQATKELEDELRRVREANAEAERQLIQDAQLRLEKQWEAEYNEAEERDQLYRAMCIHFGRVGRDGRDGCVKGKRCPFAHSEGELRPYKVPDSREQTKPCRNWAATGSCRFDTNCLFLHGKKQDEGEEHRLERPADLTLADVANVKLTSRTAARPATWFSTGIRTGPPPKPTGPVPKPAVPTNDDDGFEEYEL
jgi:hypothetical protein